MKKAFSIFLILVAAQFIATELFSQKHAFVSDIRVTGNEHTKDAIILRELPFRKGDLIEMGSLDLLFRIGRDNILNLSLFNFVFVTYIANAADLDNKYLNIEVVIRVDERWYYWPKLNLSLDEHNINTWIRDPDWSKFTAEAGISFNNLFGRNQNVKALYTMGFRRGFIFSYRNIILDREGKHSIDLSLFQEFSRHLNIGISDNSPESFRSDSLFLIKRYSSSVSYQFRPGLRLRNRFTFSYEYADLAPEVFEKNPDYWGGEEYRRSILSFTYNVTYDHRDNRQYPLDGYLLFCQMKGSSNSRFNMQYGQLKGEFHYYKELAKRFNMTARVQAGTSAKSQEAYIFDRAIGYDEVNMRGFEYYVADGQHYLTLSPTILYNIMPQASFIIKPLRKFPSFSKVHAALYAKCFIDLGYASHKYASLQNEMSNKILLSGGVGLDLVAYYDITLSMEYSLNNFGKHGLFVAFKKPMF